MGKSVSDAANNAGGFMADATGAGDVAKWGGAIAAAQQKEARRQYNELKGMYQTATTSGLASLDRDIKNQEKNLARQEQLISQLDPTIIEAAQQALKLMRGETSQTLAPLQRQRQMQRDKLLSRLREQLGPGAETSTAGIQALNRFDAETDTLFAGAQQQALGNLGSLSAQFTSQRPDMFREIAGLSSFGQAQTGLRFDQANALHAIGGLKLGTAGAQWAGNLMNAQAKQQQLLAHQDDARQIGRSWATMGMSNMGGGRGGGFNLASKGTGGGSGNSGASGGYQLSNQGTTDSNFWSKNPYGG